MIGWKESVINSCATLRRLATLCALLCLCWSAQATHQRAGEISYTYISGLTYEFTVTTYTYSLSPADRPEIEVLWGDGSSSTIQRTQLVELGNEINKNVYVARHTFPAAGNFFVSFEDPNRNAGIVNIPGSVEIPFFVETMVSINPFLGGNSSPQLMNPPIDNGCTNVVYFHNPGAYDADGDSLSYSLIYCRGYNGEDIPGYSMPNASHSISIDAHTGDLVWDSPTMAGEYNVAILIQEWRNGMLVGAMVRDMQITIAPCNNQPPEIVVQDTCVTAGTLLAIPIGVADSTSTQATLTATGEPLMLTISPAHFNPITAEVPFTTHLVWQTTCDHVRNTPYTLLLKAQDNGPQVELVAFKSLHIRIVAPAPQDLTALPYGNEIHLSWRPDTCANAVGYDVYRREGPHPFEPDHCQTGLPESEGYQWIGSTLAWEDTSFVDDGAFLPLYHGHEYCYRVVAVFPDGAESYVSNEACTQILIDAPRITHADVVTTDSLAGVVKVRWISPLQMDSITFQPPYFYDLYRAVGHSSEWQSLNDSPVPALSADTVEFFDVNLNTVANDYTYKVSFYNADTVIEYSDPATTIFLQVTPGDRKLNLSWSVQQPWQNVQYVVYRLNEESQQWDTLAVTRERSYCDRNLENGQEYCYFVCAEGYYWAPDTLGPFFNRSQFVCASPVDNEPPALPAVSVTTDCQRVVFSWLFDSAEDASDALYYYIYYKPTLEGAFTCVDSFALAEENLCAPEPCSFELPLDGTIVGCFAMRIADANGNITACSDSTCFDIYDCLNYRLPNVFTPNGDHVNDLFVPFPQYGGVSRVDMRIYNRWGRLVFQTDNPDIRWDGTCMDTHQIGSDGVYYYSCEVFFNTLAGESSFSLHGTVTMIK